MSEYCRCKFTAFFVDAIRWWRGFLADLFLYQRDGGRHGYLAFGLRTRQGRWIGPPDVAARYSIALVNYLKYLYLGKDVSGTESPTRQLQVFIDSSRPLDAASQALVLELFEEARGRLDPLLWPEAIP